MRLKIINYIDVKTARLITPRMLERVETFAEIFSAKYRFGYQVFLYFYASLWTLFVFIGFQVIARVVTLAISGVAYLASAVGLIDYRKLFAETTVTPQQNDLLLTLIHSPVLFWTAILGLAWIISTALLTVLSGLSRRPLAGITILPSEAPELFDTVNRIANEVETRIDKIVITNGFQFAAYVITLRPGEQNNLIIGYPALLALSVVDAEGIIAHEAAHLKLRHPQEMGLIEQARLAWCTLLNGYRERAPLLYIPMAILFFWYAPVLGVLVHVRRKQQELGCR